MSRLRVCKRRSEAPSTLFGTRGPGARHRVMKSRGATKTTPSSTHPRRARASWALGGGPASTRAG
eukprot:4171291-Pyramimonas_sp.AAC.1